MEKTNVCSEFTLRCYRVSETPKMFILGCMMNRKRKDSDEYTTPVYMEVLCIKEKCKGVENSLQAMIERYEKKFVRVNGTFMPTEHIKQDGTVAADQKIWADEVWLADPSDNANYNRCEDWVMFCHQQKVTDEAVTLNCTMNKKKKEGGYTKAVTIYVVCPSASCDIERDAYASSLVKVSGRFLPDEYKTSSDEYKATMKIFADTVGKPSK